MRKRSTSASTSGRLALSANSHCPPRSRTSAAASLWQWMASPVTSIAVRSSSPSRVRAAVISDSMNATLRTRVALQSLDNLRVDRVLRKGFRALVGDPVQGGLCREPVATRLLVKVSGTRSPRPSARAYGWVALFRWAGPHGGSHRGLPRPGAAPTNIVKNQLRPPHQPRPIRIARWGRQRELQWRSQIHDGGGGSATGCKRSLAGFRRASMAGRCSSSAERGHEWFREARRNLAEEKEPERTGLNGPANDSN